MSALGERLPWWWLRDAECRALGFGAEARRTERGVLFGRPDARIRIEVLPASEQGAARVGDVSLRFWGVAPGPATDLLVATAARFLGTRRRPGFNPDEPGLPFVTTEATRKPEPAPATNDGDDARALGAAPDAEPAGAGADANAEGAAMNEAGEAPSAGWVPREEEIVVSVPSTCAQACVFCSVSRVPPWMRFAREADANVERAIERATGTVVLAGDDALSHPRILDFVASAASRGLPVDVIGPPRAGRTAALAHKLAAAGLRRWRTGLFGGAAVHDRVVQQPGAFAAVMETATAMRAAGVRVQLLTLLIRDVLPELPAIVELAAQHATDPLSILVYAPDNEVGTSFDGLIPPWSSIRDGLAGIASAWARAEEIPLCVLPPAWRGGAGRLYRTDDRIRVVFAPETCGACAARPRCPGASEASHRAVGPAGLCSIDAP